VLHDGTFVVAKKGGECWKDQTWQGSEDHGAFGRLFCSSLHPHTESASPHEITLVGAILASGFVKEKPRPLIGDKAYDFDPLDKTLLEEEGIEMIVPHRTNRKKEMTQDGRRLRRYKRRWKFERLFAWLSNFRRRLVVSYEYKAENFLVTAQLGCIGILLRKCL
jgi:transposase